MYYIIAEDRIEYRNEEGKTLALQTFSEIGEGIVEIDHTEVDGSLQGQGIAGRMTELAVVYLKNPVKFLSHGDFLSFRKKQPDRPYARNRL